MFTLPHFIKGNNMITQKELKEMLHYEPDTGVFTWKVYRAWNSDIDDIAGTLRPDGYIKIGINNKSYLAHRLAWLYMTGEFPTSDTDHKYRDRSDNRWKHLRDITRSFNNINASIHNNNTSTITGISRDKCSNKWRASITINRKAINLGRYINFTDAVQARYDAEIKYGFTKYNANSSAYEYLKEINNGR
jgi:citrate synthase